MDPVPYEIREEDVDEVLEAHEPAGGGEWPEEVRQEARAHVLKHVTEIDEIVRSAAEDPSADVEGLTARAGPISDRPGDREPDRRDMALAAIEDFLIGAGFIDLAEDESRVFPVTADHDTEREDA